MCCSADMDMSDYKDQDDTSAVAATYDCDVGQDCNKSADCELWTICSSGSGQFVFGVSKRSDSD